MGDSAFRKGAVVAGTIFLLLASVLNTAAQSQQKRRKTALVTGDILIGALFSVHHQPKQKSAYTLTCGEIREQYGIQRVEAAFLAVDKINADNQILPNIRLGVEIRDSCWYSSIALEQSIEFIRDSLSTPSTTTNTSDICRMGGSRSNKHLVGVVGPGSSDVTIQVQNLLQLFSIPQVGYSATSRDLSDKSRFSYFMRVVPSDYYQAQVMIDIVRHYNWTYVSAVHTHGNYGQSGMAAFRELAEQNNICIAKEDFVLSNAEDESFDNVVLQLLDDARANVVVCFCEGMTVRNLLLAAQRHNVTSRFLFIGSDGWADRSDVVAGLEEVAVGGLSVKIQSSYVAEFDDHYFDLQPHNNTRNPWFKEFWQNRFNCTLPGHEESTSLPNCSGSESLRKGYKQDTKMAFVIKAIYTMAWGLHLMQQDLCPSEQGLCNAMLPVNGSLFREYLMNVTFTYMGETVTFDSKGDPPGRYDIMNYQRLENGSYDYVRVGQWDNGTLVVHEERVVFNRPGNHPPSSVCSEPCESNEYKSFVETGEGTQRCCWICTPCDEGEYLKNETACEHCPPGYWPNINTTACDPLPVKHINWRAADSIVALSLAALGFLATTFTMTVFIKYNHTPVVKASTRELSYLIFVGMMISYLASIPLLARPSPLTCAATRVLPGLSFAMIYAALVTKTNRIARILAGNKKKIITRKPRFMSATAQVVITCILISIEAGIITAMLLLDPPDARHYYPNPQAVELVCNTTLRGIIAPMAWVFFLIVMCTVYAVKTRNLPENFNEAKFIGFSMYTTCVIWLAWLPIYFGSNHKIICMSMCTSLSALVTLVLLFFPKLYIMLFRPEKNDRSEFKTATTVRCHIGSSNKTSLSRSSGHTPSAAMETMVGSTMLGLGMPPQANLLQRIRSTLAAPFIPAVGILPRDSHPRAALRREIRSCAVLYPKHVWSDVSGSGATGTTGATATARDIMLRRAYGSQLDLTAEGLWYGREEQACQTSDDLLDPLIPRLRRRVVRAVRERTLDAAEGRDFFSLTHVWMASQAEAAKSEMAKSGSDNQNTTAKTIIIKAPPTTTTTPSTTTPTTTPIQTKPSTITTTITTTTTTTTNNVNTVTKTTKTSPTTTPTNTDTRPTTRDIEEQKSSARKHEISAIVEKRRSSEECVKVEPLQCSSVKEPESSENEGEQKSRAREQDISLVVEKSSEECVKVEPLHCSSVKKSESSENEREQKSSDHSQVCSSVVPLETVSMLAGNASDNQNNLKSSSTCSQNGCKSQKSQEFYKDNASLSPVDEPNSKQSDCEDEPICKDGCPSGETVSGTQLVGYGSPLPCGMDWNGRKGSGCNGFGQHSTVPPFSQATQTDLSQDYQGWTYSGDGEKLIGRNLENNKKTEIVRRKEVHPNRRRKVGVAKVSDVRGILKYVPFSRSDKTARVSFDSKSSSVTCPVETYKDLPGESGDDNESDRDGQQHSMQSETSFSIFEEAVNVDSDAEASDNCELKTITIKLGCDETDALAVPKSKLADRRKINWRPKLGKNHSAFRAGVATGGYENPSVRSETDIPVVQTIDNSSHFTSDLGSPSLLKSKEVNGERNKYSSERNKYSSEGNKCSSEGNKYSSEGNKYLSEGNKYSSEGKKYLNEGNIYSSYEGNKYSSEGNIYSNEENTNLVEGNKYSSENELVILDLLHSSNRQPSRDSSVVEAVNFQDDQSQCQSFQTESQSQVIPGESTGHSRSFNKDTSPSIHHPIVPSTLPCSSSPLHYPISPSLHSPTSTSPLHHPISTSSPFHYPTSTSSPHHHPTSSSPLHSTSSSSRLHQPTSTSSPLTYSTSSLHTSTYHSPQDIASHPPIDSTSPHSSYPLPYSTSYPPVGSISQPPVDYTSPHSSHPPLNSTFYTSQLPLEYSTSHSPVDSTSHPPFDSTHTSPCTSYPPLDSTSPQYSPAHPLSYCISPLHKPPSPFASPSTSPSHSSTSTCHSVIPTCHSTQSFHHPTQLSCIGSPPSIHPTQSFHPTHLSCIGSPTSIHPTSYCSHPSLQNASPILPTSPFHHPTSPCHHPIPSCHYHPSSSSCQSFSSPHSTSSLVSPTSRPQISPIFTRHSVILDDTVYGESIISQTALGEDCELEVACISSSPNFNTLWDAVPPPPDFHTSPRISSPPRIPSLTSVQPLTLPVLPSTSPILSSPSVKPSTSSLQPVTSQVQPLTSPLQPSIPPVQPSKSVLSSTSPVLSTQPVQPSISPVLPLTSPVQPLIPLVQPTTSPGLPTPPAQPLTSPVQPSTPSVLSTPPVQPSIPPVKPSTTRVLPSLPPVLSSTSPVLPSIPPVPPSTSPVLQSTSPILSSLPVQPSTSLVLPLTPAVQPSIPLVQPLTSPTQPSTSSVLSSIAPIQPSTPVLPSTPPVQPSTPPIQPSLTSVQPSTPPVQPSTPPVLPTPQVQPSTSPLQPSISPVQPSTPPVQPSSPLQPSISPVQPSTSPAQQPLYPLQQAQSEMPLGVEGRADGTLRLRELKLRNNTEEDTDSETTPIKEFFLNHGIKFDPTSTKSKKL